MIPKLYQKDGTTLIGNLTNCIECLVEEERNGIFEITLTYPNEEIASSLVYDNIIICDANDTLKNQKFRIYDTRRMMNDTIDVYARHISFDLAYDYINSIDITNQSCEYALNTIFRSSQFSAGYVGHSDIVNAQNYKISNCNALEAIAGKEGSIIDTYGTGAEILRDNTDIYVLNRRGNDNEVSIEYAKNLTGFELQENTDDLITRIIPFATYTPEGGEQTRVQGSAVDSSYIGNYSHPFIAELDFSDKFEDNEVPTTAKLNTMAQRYFEENKCDLPKQNWKIEFIPLSKCVGYESIEDAISLCDTVTIRDTRYSINTKAKVIKTVYDVLRERYDSMELGEPRTTLGDIVNTGSEKGEQGPPGPQGPKGEDGNIGDFPDSVPAKPVLTTTLLGFASIQLDWTYENKPYYWYEVYASKTKDFTPNLFDIIHKGQTSSFLFQAKPGETWYFRVCGVNSYDHRSGFSDQKEVITTKVDDLSNYFTTAAIGHAVVGSLTADYMTAGILKGNWIDAKNLSVTDGNGKRTLDIDSYGNVALDVTTFKINSNDISDNLSNITSRLTTAENKITPTAIKNTVSEDFYTKGQTDTAFATKSEVTQTADELQIAISKTGVPNLITNGDFSSQLKFWYPWNSTTVYETSGAKKVHVSPTSTSGTITFGVQLPAFDVEQGKTYTVAFWVESNKISILNYNWLMNGGEGIQRIGNVEFSTTDGVMVRCSITFTSLYTRNVNIMLGYEGTYSSDIYFRIAESCCYEGTVAYPYKKSDNEIYSGITFVDMEGLGVKHTDGSISKLTAEELQFTNTLQQKKMAIKKGTLYAYDINSGALLGMFSSNRVGDMYKGVTTGIAGSSHYYAIGVTGELADTDELSMTPYILIAQQDLTNFLGKDIINAGINFMNTNTIFHKPAVFKVSPIFPDGVTFDINGTFTNLYFQNNTAYLESNLNLITGGSYYGGGLYGEDTTSIGYKLNGAYTDVIKLYTSIQEIDFLRPLNMNDFGIFNGYIASGSDIRVKHDVDEFTNWEDYYNFYMSLKPKTFKYNSDENEETHIGLIAQEVNESISENNLNSENLSIIKTVKDENMDNGKKYNIVYQELISLNMKMIQKHEKEIQELKTIISQQQEIINQLLTDK
jgi:phage minor structural protein